MIIVGKGGIKTDEIMPDFLFLTSDFVGKIAQGKVKQTMLSKLASFSKTSFIFVESYEDGVGKYLQNFYVFPFKVKRNEFIDFFGAERTKVINDEKDVEELGERKESPAGSTTAVKQQIKRNIPLLDTKREFAFFSTHIRNALFSIFSSGKFILGDEVREFEHRVSEYLGVNYSVGVASGTDALTISLRAISYARYGKEFFGDDELVITTPFTFVATAEAILRAGAKPIFVDVEPDTFNISPEEIRKCMREYGEKIKGIVVVHLFGHSADMEEIMKIARENELFVLEDVAQAFGGEFIQSDKNKKVAKKLGSIGDAGAFSFFPSKNLGGFGDGGLISTNDEKIAEISKMLRNHGGKDKYNVSILGFNSRLDTIQAGLLLGKLGKIDELNERRRRVANLYRKLVSSSKIKLPVEKDYAKHVYHQFTIVVGASDKDLVEGYARDKLKSFLAEKGISSAVYYPILLPDMELFRGRCEVFGELKVSRELTKKVLSIPIHPFLRDDEVEFIARTLNSF